MTISGTGKFVVNIEGKNYGPFTREEILTFVEKKEITLTHFVYDINRASWSMIGDHDNFAGKTPHRPNLAAERPRFFLFSKEGIVGPYLKSQILEKLDQKEINLFDYIYYDGEKDWIRIRDSSLFSQYLLPPPLLAPNLSPGKSAGKSKPDKTDPTVEVQRTSTVRQARPPAKGKKGGFDTGGIEIGNEPVWMLIKGDEELGPFRYLEILKMIQKNVISKVDKVKKVGEGGWRKISELMEFKSNVVKKIVEDGGKKVEKIFLTRKYKRSPYLGPSQVQSKNRIFRGTCTSISLGGCFIEMRSEHFQLDEDVYIKIMSGTIPLIIESKGKVVSITSRTPRGVGFSFSHLAAEMVSEIQKYINKYGEK